MLLCPMLEGHFFPTSPLLGVGSQLWYVHNGTVNHYALSYEIVVPPQLEALTFYWQALQGRTVRGRNHCLLAVCDKVEFPYFRNSEILTFFFFFFFFFCVCVCVCVCVFT